MKVAGAAGFDVLLRVIASENGESGASARTAESSEVLACAEYHGLVPHLHRWLLRRGHAIPEAIRRAAQHNAQRNLLLFAHTCRAVETLQLHGIPVVTLKGVALAQLLYGDISMRVCSDVDVLVPRDRMLEAARCLEPIGFTPETPLDTDQLGTYLQRSHDLALLHPDGTLLELHCDIAQHHYAYAFDMSAWLAEARSLNVANHPLPALSPEHAATLAIVHGTKHLWTRLDMVADLAAFRAVPVDWPRVDQLLRTAGTARAAAVAADLTDALCGWAPPLDRAGRTAAALAAQAARRLANSQLPGFWQARWLDLRVRERTVDRLRYVARLGLGLPF